MRTKPILLLLLVLLVLSSGIWAVTGSQQTMTLGTTPGNPAAGKIRLWANTATGWLECLTSAGASCIDAVALNGTAFAGTNGHLVSFGASNAPADSGVVAANVVNASSPGVGLCHFAGSTQTCTSSLIVAADITSATITGAQIASSVALAGSPTTTTQSPSDNSTKVATTAYADAAAAAGGGGGAIPTNVQMQGVRGTTLAYPFNVTSGHTLIVAIGWEGGANTASSISDTVSTSWTKVIEQTGNADTDCAIFVGSAGGSGANTVTPTFPASSGFSGVYVSEWTNTSTTSDGTLNALLSVSNGLTTSFDGDLIINMEQGNTSSVTIPYSWFNWVGLTTSGSDSGGFWWYRQFKAGKIQLYVPNTSSVTRTCGAAFKHS